MNELARKQIHEDYREILSSDAGKRVLGGIFYRGRINGVGLMTDYLQGKPDSEHGVRGQSLRSSRQHDSLRRIYEGVFRQ